MVVDKTTRQLVNNRGIPKTQRVSGSTKRMEVETGYKLKRTEVESCYREYRNVQIFHYFSYFISSASKGLKTSTEIMSSI